MLVSGSAAASRYKSEVKDAMRHTKCTNNGLFFLPNSSGSIWRMGPQVRVGPYAYYQNER